MRKITPEDITLRREDRPLNTAEITQMKSNLDKIVADKNVSNKDKRLARKTFETIASSGANASINNGNITFGNSVGKNIDDKIAYKSKTLVGKAAELFTGNGVGLDKTLMRSLSKGISNDAAIKDPIVKATNSVRDHYNSLNIKRIDTPSIEIPDISNIWDSPIDDVKEAVATTGANTGKKAGTGKKTTVNNKTTVGPPADNSGSNLTVSGGIVPNNSSANPALTTTRALTTIPVGPNAPKSSVISQPAVTSQPVVEADLEVVKLNDLISQQQEFLDFNQVQIEKLNTEIKTIREHYNTNFRSLSPESINKTNNKVKTMMSQLRTLISTNYNHIAAKKQHENTLDNYRNKSRRAKEDIDKKAKSMEAEERMKALIKKDGGVIKLQYGSRVLIDDFTLLKNKVRNKKNPNGLSSNNPSDVFLHSLGRQRLNSGLRASRSNLTSPSNQSITTRPITRQQIPNNNVTANAVTPTNSTVTGVTPRDSASGLNTNNTTDVVVNKTPISGIQALSALFPAVSAFAMKRNSANINYAEQYVAPARGLNQDYINSMSNSLGASENQALNNNTSTDFSTRMNMAANLGANRTKTFNELNVNDANAYSQSKALETQGVNTNNNSRNDFTNNYKIGVAKSKNEDQQVKVTGFASTLGAFGKLAADRNTEENMRRSQGMQLSQANAANTYTSNKELLMANYAQNKNLFNPLFTSKDSNGTYINVDTGKPHANQQMFIDAEQNLGKITSDLNGLNGKYNNQQIENFNRDINSGTKRRGFLPWLTGSQGNRVFKKGGLTLIERKELQSHRESIKDTTKDLKRLALDYIKENNNQNNRVADRNLQKLRLLLLRK